MSQAFSLGISGPTGSIKSSIALSFPDPVVLDFDLRLHGVRQELKDKIVRHHEFQAPIHIPLSGETRGNQVNIIMQGWREMYDMFVQTLLQELAAKDCGTIVIDTGTQMRETVNNGYLQELQEATKPGQDIRHQLQQIEYGAPNKRIQSIYQAVKSANKFLVVTHYEEDEYVTKEIFDPRSGQMIRESVQTGRKVLKGWNNTANQMDLMLETSLEMVEDKNEAGHVVGHHVGAFGTITKAGLALEMLQVKMMNPSYDSIVGYLRMMRPGSGW
jgi:hypothetical protein